MLACQYIHKHRACPHKWMKTDRQTLRLKHRCRAADNNNAQTPHTPHRVDPANKSQTCVVLDWTDQWNSVESGQYRSLANIAGRTLSGG